MGEHDTARVDALLVQDLQHVVAALRRRVRVDGHRRVGLVVHAAARAHDTLDVVGRPVVVHRAFEHRGLDAGALDALLDVAAEELVQRLVAVEQRARAHEVPQPRQHVVGVEAGGERDLQPAALDRALHQVHVAPEAEHRQLDDRVVAGLLEL